MEILNTVKIGITLIFSLYFFGLAFSLLFRAIAFMSKAIKFERDILNNTQLSDSNSCKVDYGKMANQCIIQAVILLVILVILNLLLPELFCYILERLWH